MACDDFLKSLYYSAFAVAILGFVMEAWDIQHNVPFTHWLTGALALVTLLKIPYKACKIWFIGRREKRDWLPLVELLISLVAYVYLTYINIDKSDAMKVGKLNLDLPGKIQL